MEKQDLKRLLFCVKVSGALVGLMWAVHFLIYYLGFDGITFATIPRSPHGLLGILTSPFIHGDIFHLLSNSGPLFFFAAGMLFFYREAALKAAIFIYFLTGIWVWAFAHAGSHIGASGLVYGFGAFLFFSGIFRREPRSIALSLIIALMYGGMVWGVLPGQAGISWESHLFGGISGTLMAWQYRKIGLPQRKKYSWEDQPEVEQEDANAPWYYQQNWPGSEDLFISQEDPKDDSPLE